MIGYYNDNNKQKKWNTNSIKQWTGNNIGDEGANQISESLKTNTTLTKLDLEGDGKMKLHYYVSYVNDISYIDGVISLFWGRAFQWLNWGRGFKSFHFLFLSFLIDILTNINPRRTKQRS